MTKNNKNKRPKQKAHQQRDATLHSDLRQLIRLQDNQALKREPRVLDQLPMRVPANRIYTSVQTIGLGNIIPSSTLPTFGAFMFSLSQLVDAASFETIFDAWRIMQVEVQFLPRSPISSSTSSLLTVIDYDDANVLTSVQQAYSYDTLQVSPAGVPTTRVFSPRVATAVYTGSAFNGYSRLPKAAWIDSASPSTDYFGLKYVLNAVTTAPSVSEFDIYATVIFQFRSQRG